MKASELLEKSAQVIQERGHHKGAYEAPDGSGRVCLFGAMNVVMTGRANLSGALAKHEEYHPAIEHSVEALMRVTKVVYLETWNDQPEISAEDVMLAMKQAAALLAEKGD